MRTHDAEAGAGAAAAGPEPLFARTTAGGTWAFVALPDGCALLRDGERVASGDASPSSVGRVLDEFLRVTRSGATAAAGLREP